MSYVDYGCNLIPSGTVVSKLDIATDGARACINSLFGTKFTEHANGNIMLDFIRDDWEYLCKYPTILAALEMLTPQEKDFITTMRAVIGKPHLAAQSSLFPQEWFNALVANEVKAMQNLAQNLAHVETLVGVMRDVAEVQMVMAEADAAKNAETFLRKMLTPPSDIPAWVLIND